MLKLPLLLAVFAVSTLMAQDFSYQGTSGCAICHKSSKKGNQLGAWEKTKHAKAFETLKSEKAVQIAQEKGLKTPPAESGECLVCHVTGWEKAGGYQVLGADFIADEANARAVKKNNSKASVGCESCHGPGSKYKSKKTMEGIFAGTIAPASVGLVLPDEALCVTCHNQTSPTFKELNYSEMAPTIAHPYPADIKATRGRK